VGCTPRTRPNPVGGAPAIPPVDRCSWTSRAPGRVTPGPGRPAGSGRRSASSRRPRRPRRSVRRRPARGPGPRASRPTRDPGAGIDVLGGPPPAQRRAVPQPRSPAHHRDPVHLRPPPSTSGRLRPPDEPEQPAPRPPLAPRWESPPTPPRPADSQPWRRPGRGPDKPSATGTLSDWCPYPVPRSGSAPTSARAPCSCPARWRRCAGPGRTSASARGGELDHPARPQGLDRRARPVRDEPFAVPPARLGKYLPQPRQVPAATIDRAGPRRTRVIVPGACPVRPRHPGGSRLVQFPGAGGHPGPGRTVPCTRQS